MTFRCLHLYRIPWLLLWSFTFVGRLTSPLASEPPLPPWPVALSNYLAMVVSGNERVQIQALEYESTRQLASGQKGIFEPSLVLGAEHTDSQRQLNSQGFSTTVGLRTNLVAERNNNYSAALELLVPVGGKLRIGYNLHDLFNTYQRIGLSRFTNGEYESFAGISMVQPLLKNAGTRTTLANLRIAASQSEIAWHGYQRQLIQTVAGAESAYWGLHLAQQQVGFYDESVRVAETVLADARKGNAVGRSGETEVIQAEADLAMRRNGRNEALQKLSEARARVAGFMEATDRDARGSILASSEPAPSSIEPAYEKEWRIAYEQNSDLRIQRTRLEQEGIRVVYAKNQRLPQLDLKASYGLNGLDRTPGSSFDIVRNGDFPAWTIGVELRVPLGGGLKERSDLAAAKARKEAAILGLHDLETQVANNLHVGIGKVRFTRGAIDDYNATVRLNEALVKSEMARHQVGRVEARKVLEAERDLLQAKLAALASVIAHQQSLIELEVVNGTYLIRRQLSTTRDRLKKQTSEWLQRGTPTHQRTQLDSNRSITPTPATPATP